MLNKNSVIEVTEVAQSERSVRGSTLALISRYKLMEYLDLNYIDGIRTTANRVRARSSDTRTGKSSTGGRSRRAGASGSGGCDFGLSSCQLKLTSGVGS